MTASVLERLAPSIRVTCATAHDAWDTRSRNKEGKAGRRGDPDSLSQAVRKGSSAMCRTQ